MDAIPWTDVFCYLTVDDLVECLRACKKWRDILNEYNAWISIAKERELYITMYWEFEKEPMNFDFGLGVKTLWLAQSRRWIRQEVYSNLHDREIDFRSGEVERMIYHPLPYVKFAPVCECGSKDHPFITYHIDKQKMNLFHITLFPLQISKSYLTITFGPCYIRSWSYAPSFFQNTPKYIPFDIENKEKVFFLNIHAWNSANAKTYNYLYDIPTQHMNDFDRVLLYTYRYMKDDESMVLMRSVVHYLNKRFLPYRNTWLGQYDPILLKYRMFPFGLELQDTIEREMTILRSMNATIEWIKKRFYPDRFPNKIQRKIVDLPFFEKKEDLYRL